MVPKKNPITPFKAIQPLPAVETPNTTGVTPIAPFKMTPSTTVESGAIPPVVVKTDSSTISPQYQSAALQVASQPLTQPPNQTSNQTVTPFIQKTPQKTPQKSPHKTPFVPVFPQPSLQTQVPLQTQQASHQAPNQASQQTPQQTPQYQKVPTVQRKGVPSFKPTVPVTQSSGAHQSEISESDFFKSGGAVDEEGKPILTDGEKGLAWMNSLRDHLYNVVLPLAEKDDVLRAQLVDQNAMMVWMKAFTHESYNPNIGENYEEFEKLGDSVMKAAFIQFVMEKYPTAAKDQLSNLQMEYVSKPFQAKIANDLKLPLFIRSNIKTDMSSAEDLTESLFGALFTIADMNFRVGAGWVLARNLLINLYDSVDLDPNKVMINNVNRIKEAFEKFKWGTVIGTTSSEGTFTTFTIRIPSSAPNDLRAVGITLNDTIIGVGKGNTKKVAKLNAYKVAVENFTKFGILSYIDNLKKQEFNSPQFLPYKEKAFEKMRRQGLVELTYNTVKKAQMVHIQLVGKMADGYMVPLLTTAIPSNENLDDGKLSLIKKYVEG